MLIRWIGCLVSAVHCVFERREVASAVERELFNLTLGAFTILQGNPSFHFLAPLALRKRKQFVVSADNYSLPWRLT